MSASSRVSWSLLLLVVATAGDAQVSPNVSVAQVTSFLTSSGPSRYEEASARGRILAAEVGAAASAPLTEILSQPIQKNRLHLLIRALAAASYSPVTVPESVLLRYASLSADAANLGRSEAGDLRVRALVALSNRPRPLLVGFWTDLWNTERDPLIRQFALSGLACSDPETVRPMLAMAHGNRLLDEVAGRIAEELQKGDDALVCHGGESSRLNAASFRPDVPPDARQEGRAMLRRAGIVR